MEKDIFIREDRKYSQLWMNGYKDANWIRLATVVLKEINENNCLSIIDFGFGKGNAMKYFENKGFKIYGTEISSYAVEKQKENGKEVFHASLDNLEIFRDNQFNIGFCNDVIEHIPTNLIIKSLEEMTRVCSDYLFISVCPTPAHHKSLEGEQLHLTIQPAKWWEEQLKKFGELKKTYLLFSRSLRYSIKLN
jgi:ubiquinone/menaquinone biosynthesis C-methylase UbiE